MLLYFYVFNFGSREWIQKVKVKKQVNNAKCIPSFIFCPLSRSLGIDRHIDKLDGVGPIDDRPSPDKLQQFVKKKWGGGGGSGEASLRNCIIEHSL